MYIQREYNPQKAERSRIVFFMPSNSTSIFATVWSRAIDGAETISLRSDLPYLEYSRVE